jgi:hypothetical protein
MTPTPPATTPDRRAAGEVYVLRVRVLPGDVPAILRLRSAFKVLLRSFRVRIKSAEPAATGGNLRQPGGRR